MKLAFDVDDVLLDFGGRVIQTVNKEYDAGLSLEDVTSWDLNKLLDPILGEDWWAWWEERDWLWSKADAINGAMGGLRRLHQQGHYIQLVTAKPYWARKGLNHWLARWNPYFDELIVGEARPPMEKHLVSDALILTDDKPDNCIEWAETGRIALLFDRPHNREHEWAASFYHGDVAQPGYITRVRDWDEVLAAIEEVSFFQEVSS